MRLGVAIVLWPLKLVTVALFVVATAFARADDVAPPLIHVVTTRGQCTNCDSPYGLATLHLHSLSSGFATASFLPSGNGSGLSTVLWTDTGGRQWRRLAFAQQRSAEQTPTVFFIDAKRGWIASFDSWTAKASLSHTTDGGRSWTHMASPIISGLQFFSATEGYSVAVDAQATWFRRTRNGGDAWRSTQLPLSHVDSMSFFDRNVGVVAGAGDDGLAVIATHDGGVSWRQASFPAGLTGTRVTLVRWRSRSSVVAAVQGMDGQGDVLAVSSDGGETWTKISAPPFSVSEFRIKDIVIDPRGGLYVFYDGGKGSFVAASRDTLTWRTVAMPATVTSCQMFGERFICGSGLALVSFEFSSTSGATAFATSVPGPNAGCPASHAPSTRRGLP